MELFISDHIKAKMDPAIHEHIDTKADPFIQDHIKTKIDPAIQEHIDKKMDPFIQDFIKTKIDPAIQEHIDKKMDPFIQDHIKTKIDSVILEHIDTKIDRFIQDLDLIKTKIDPAIQEHITSEIDPAIQEHITPEIDPAIQECIDKQVDAFIQDNIYTKIDPAIQKYIETKIVELYLPESVLYQTIEKQIKKTFDATIQKPAVKANNQLKVKDWTDSPYIQIVKTSTLRSVVIVLALAVYWNLGRNGNENMTSLPNSTIVVQDKAFMENVTLSLQHLKDELLQCQNNFKEMQTAVSKVTDSLLYVKRDVKVLEGQEEIRTSKTIFSDTVFIFLFGMAVEGLIFILLIKYLLGNRTVAHTDTVGNSEISQSRPSKLLEQVKQVQLDRSVCIVSFYEETQDLHLRLARSAIQTDIPIKQFLMKSPETQLLFIPKSRFILVFIDYNDRNIILETPGQDLGDKKVVTVQAAQKMGADVFVVYVRDKGSTNLPHGVLYNEHLTSFTRNLTLGNLTVRNRGLSVFETFTDHQKCHLNGIIY